MISVLQSVVSVCPLYFLAFKIHTTVHAVLTQVKRDFSVSLVQMNATELEEHVLKENF